MWKKLTENEWDIERWKKKKRKARRQLLRAKRKNAPANKHYGAIAENVESDIDPERYAEKKIGDIKIQTRSQSMFILWMQERKKRNTASKFGKICKIRETINRYSQKVIWIFYCRCVQSRTLDIKAYG